MNANELMIGDWVLYDNYPARVKLIGDTMVKLRNFDYCIDVDHVLPIPLTAEILEKNGWKKEPQIDPAVSVCIQLFNDDYFLDEEIRVDCDPYGDYHFMHKGTHFCFVNYVHELQHALRLCGIKKEVEL